MSTREYICPTCGVTLQSAQDVSGRKVRCLGCQTAFIAKGSEPAPVVVTQPPRPPKPARRARDEEPEAPAPYLPPLPRKRGVPVAIYVVAAVLVCGIGLSVFAIYHFKSVIDEREQLAQAAKAEKGKEKGAPVKTKTSKIDSPTVAKVDTPHVAPGVPGTRKAEEEEETAAPKPETKPKPAEKTEPRLPDLNSILPKLPGPNKFNAGPTEERPKPSVGEPSEPTESRPPAPKTGSKESSVSTDGSIPSDRLNRIKASTVFVKVDAGTMGGSGSGFVLTVTGDTAQIVTNQHVVHPKTKQGTVLRNVVYEVVFHSGRKNEFSLKAELVAADREHDLAVLRVSGVKSEKDFPGALNTSDRPSIAETTPIFVVGFPFGERLSFAKGNPNVTISKGTITSVREDEVGDTATIQIDGDSNPGNSGGPVIDAQGRLIGVLQGGKPGTKINFAIPYIELSRMLMGRVSNLTFRVARSTGNSIEMEVTGDLVDPNNRVKSCSLRAVRADDLKTKLVVGSDSRWSALPSSEKTEFRINGTTVSGRLKLPVRDSDRGRIEIHFQPACVDSDGKTNFFAPVLQTLTIAQGKGKGPFPSGPGGFSPMSPGSADPGIGIPGGVTPTGPGGGLLPPQPPGPGPGVLPPGGVPQLPRPGGG